MIRLLQSNENGLPIEFYFFIKHIEWVKFENVQVEIYDHLFASLHYFGIKAFQRNTDGDTFRKR